MQVRGDGGRREGRILGGVFRPRFSGRIWRYLRVRLGVVLVGTIARFIDGVPIVTHCGGGGRGQKAKDYLIGLGYTNVVNGGGPKVTELWERFGSL